MYVHPDKIYGNNRYSKLIPADREGKDTKHDAKKSRKDNTKRSLTYGIKMKGEEKKKLATRCTLRVIHAVPCSLE